MTERGGGGVRKGREMGERGRKGERNHTDDGCALPDCYTLDYRLVI